MTEITYDYLSGTGTGSSANIARCNCGKDIIAKIGEYFTELGLTRIDTNGAHEVADGSGSAFCLNEYWRLQEEDTWCLGISVRYSSPNYYIGIYITEMPDTFKPDTNTSTGYISGGVVTFGVQVSQTTSSSTGVTVSTAETLAVTHIVKDNMNLYGISESETRSMAEFFGIININDIPSIIISEGDYRLRCCYQNNERYSGAYRFDGVKGYNFNDEIIVAPIFLGSSNMGANMYYDERIPDIYECPEGIIAKNQKYSINGQMYLAIGDKLLLNIE